VTDTERDRKQRRAKEKTQQKVDRVKSNCVQKRLGVGRALMIRGEREGGMRVRFEEGKEIATQKKTIPVA